MACVCMGSYLRIRSPARESALRWCVLRKLSRRSPPEQPGRGQEQRYEEPIEPQDFPHGSIRGLALSGDQRDHSDRCLSDRRGDHPAARRSKVPCICIEVPCILPLCMNAAHY